MMDYLKRHWISVLSLIISGVAIILALKQL